MTGTLLAATGAGALGLAIAVFALAVLPARGGSRTSAGALSAILRGYARQAPAVQKDPAAATTPDWLRRLALRLSPADIAATLRRRLDLAGNPRRWSPDRMLAAKGLGLLGCAVLGALFGLHNLGLLILFACLGGAAGFFIPDLLLYNTGLKRQAAIQGHLPDALDMLTVCVEAGLGFDAALAQVARSSAGPLAQEFARALQEMQIGLSRADALRAMAERSTVAELRTFVSCLVQAGQLGIPVGRVLREQAAEMRTRRRQRAEERAQKVPVKMMVPLITCLFPALMVLIIGPGAIEIARSILHR